MAAGTYNFEINQGADFSLALVFQDGSSAPISLTGATFLAQIRPSASSTTILAALTATPDSGTVGRLVLSLTAAQTISLSASYFPAVWDLYMTKTGVTTRMVQGAVTLSAQVSR